MIRQKLFYLVTLFFLGAIAACQTIQNPPVKSAQFPNPSTEARKQQAERTNLLALFLVKRDNLKQEYRGEIYPIAFYIDDEYVDVSDDVTLVLRNNFSSEQLIKNRQQQSFLNAVENYTMINEGRQVGNFEVQQLAVSQFACSSLLVGQGQFENNRSLADIYNATAPERSGGTSGFINGQKVDESWRSSIALHHYYPTSAQKPNSTPAELERYERDLLAAAESTISESPNIQITEVNPTIAIDKISVRDLDGDGSPEVFGQVRKGASPKAATTVYATVWLTYKNGQPQVISSQVKSYNVELPVEASDSPVYNLIGTVDVNGDGVEEVIVQNNGYEATRYGIYEYENNRLKQVFDGAGYGC
ncbi:hypothetical protein H6G17_19965 [Chroococcidiopsis sp. FACHB-1243]|uniref:FG-GAP repeat domain-containing protein n=1 Tax=Chroococcidiopsis sp. [FACHB-1243] TaxID=2692781 RepID=UPI00177E506D|nr:VCBS repeat-containing protein [Chroococcidiopsis sp. [FACHB-1243]]MBD2307748.1 hypothetical protein [Chroococcidiopsis sp. [FACHB-1243]]